MAPRFVVAQSKFRIGNLEKHQLLRSPFGKANPENQAMTEADAVSLGREFFYHAVLLTTPALVVSLIIGLIVSIFQAVTNIQEQTLSFAPRILALSALLVLTMPWLLQMSIYFTVQMFSRAAQVAH